MYTVHILYMYMYVHCVVGIPRNAMGSSPSILQCTYEIAYRKNLQYPNMPVAFSQTTASEL